MAVSNYQTLIENFTPIESLKFEHLDNRYVKVCTITYIITYVALMCLLLLLLIPDWEYRLVTLIAAEAAVVIAFAWNMTLIPKIYTFKGYAVRERDISYRSGIFFPTVTTVPFCKIQQVTLRQNPVSRMFRMYYIDIVNGSQSTMKQMVIPGLTKERAEQIKTMLISKADDER